MKAAIDAVPEFRALVDAYLDKFGDRCLEELKLESETLHDDPLPLLRAVGHLAAQPAALAADTQASSLRAQARERANRALAGHPLRRLVFNWVLRNARDRVRDRENLRFERTRLFGRVRRIFVEMGHRLHAARSARRAARRLLPRSRRGARVRRRTRDDDGSARAGAHPPRRIRGLCGSRLGDSQRRPIASRRAACRIRATTFNAPQPHRRTEIACEVRTSGDDARQGLGCCPGVVRGPVRVVFDPRTVPLDQRAILVAERTDPGWIMLFPSATGVLVERGSLLSHSAIVARELGIPAIVSVPGVTRWLRDGDWVEMDGATGRVRRIPADDARRVARRRGGHV